MSPRALVTSTILALTLAGCAANLCQRKEAFFVKKCHGVLAYSDPTCEMNLDRCNDQQITAFTSYVSCLEQLPECSMDAVSQCGSQHPAGVNLMCSGR